MTDIWPATLPQCPILNAFSERPQQNVVVFQPDVGPLKIRRRGTEKAWLSTLVFRMNSTQLAAFNIFYETTLEDGTLPFTLYHPVTKLGHIWMFKSGEQPIIRRNSPDGFLVGLALVRWESIAGEEMSLEDDDELLFEDGDEILLEA